MSRPEILAPAGDPASLKSAVYCGADAVYLGLPMFSARAKAENFTQSSLAAAVEFCHLYGTKVYLTLNTIVKPEERSEALNAARLAFEAGADAFIVQDLPFIRLLSSELPDAVVHLSTQAGVHDLCGALAAKALGVRRVILSRETLLEDIAEIREKTDLEIEYFVHGALCVAFSGNCYFSSLATGMSGNRGRCLQFCRKKYEACGKSGYFLSAKDLDLSKRLAELTAAGVTSFKIEGRMRRSEYVAATVSYYRNVVDGKAGDRDAVKRVFDRGGGCEAYLTDQTANVIFPDIQGHMGVKIGKVASVKGTRATLSLSMSPVRGDGFKFVRGGKEVGSSSVTADGPTVGFTGDVRAGDEVRITTDSALLERLRGIERRVPVRVKVSMTAGAPIEARLTSGDVSVALCSDIIAQKATTRPFTADEIAECFRKCGDTVFEADVKVTTDGDCFVARSALNEFRRDAHLRLKEAILAAYDEKLRETRKRDGLAARTQDGPGPRRIRALFAEGNGSDQSSHAPSGIRTIVGAEDLSCLNGGEGLFDAVAYSPRFYRDENLDEIAAFTEKTGKPVYLSLPVMARGDDIKVLRRLIRSDVPFGFIVNNLYGVELVGGKRTILGQMMNCIDPATDCTKIMSPEYDGRSYGDNFIYAFGKFPLMTFAHCPAKTLAGGKCLGCGDKRDELTLCEADQRSRREFSVRRFKVAYCYASLLNCVPIDLVKEANELGAAKYVDLVGFSEKECYNIFDRMRRGERLAADSTRGFFARRLE